MLEDDYLMRMLSQVAEAIARVVGLERSGEHEEALAELTRALERASGLSRALLDTLDAASIVALVGPERAGAIAELYELEATLAPRSSEPSRLRAAALRAALFPA